MKILNQLKTFLVILCVATTGTALVTGCYSGRPHETLTQDREDRVITSRVEGALQGTDYKFPDVKVETIDRSVRLTGSVDTPAHRDEAGELAQQAGDVKEVINHINVR
jgi:osmotically-inducible protein OsmY